MGDLRASNSAPKSNSSNILWLSSLLASLTKIQSKMKSLSSGQHFPKLMGPSRVGNSNVNSRKRAEIELVRDFKPAFVISKFDED